MSITVEVTHTHSLSFSKHVHQTHLLHDFAYILPPQNEDDDHHQQEDDGDQTADQNRRVALLGWAGLGGYHAGVCKTAKQQRRACFTWGVWHLHVETLETGVRVSRDVAYQSDLPGHRIPVAAETVVSAWLCVSKGSDVITGGLRVGSGLVAAPQDS